MCLCLKATAFSAACKERSDVDVSAGLVEQPCSATVSRLSGFGMGPDLRLLQSGCGAAETDFNGALSAAETALTGAVCAAETDFHGMLPRSRSLSQLRGHAGAVAGEVCFSQDHDQVVDPVHRDVSVLAELEDDCVRRRKAGCSAGVASDMSRIQVGSGRNSRIHGSQSSSFACARVSSGSLLGACVVGSASAAVGSACLPAVRTRTYADVAASACGGMAVMQRHACNSVVSGGFLPVQKSTSYNVGTGRQGPTGTRRVKGGVSGLAEDLHPVSEVEAGVNFRPAGGVRGQVAGSIPRRQPGTGPRRVREGAVTPSLHPEVPGIQFVSPGYGLEIRQSMGWTKVCGTARSGIWVLKGIARTCMFPANLDYLRVEWMKRGSYKTAWVTPGHDCLCAYKYGHGAAVRPQTNNAIWDGVIGLWSRVAPFLSPWCGKKDVPTGVNLNQYAGPGSFIRWHSDNEPLFGPQNSPKLIVSLSLGNSVEFMVRRRAPGNVPSSIRLDHGDVLVMDGLAQSEYEHCTASELQGPRVNLTYRWVAQHTASCPLTGVVGCLLPTCVKGSVEPGSRWLGEGENKWSSSWGLVLLLLILVSVLLVGTLINIRRGHRHSGQRPSCSVVHFPSRGRARWVGGRRWPLSRRRQTSKGVSFYFPFLSFWVNMVYSCFKSMFFGLFIPLGMLVAKWVPTPCYNDAYLVGTP